MFDFFDDVTNTLYEGADELLTSLGKFFADQEAPEAPTTPVPEPATPEVPVSPETPGPEPKGILDSVSPPQQAPDPGVMKEIQTQYAKGEESFKKWLDSMTPESRKIVGLAIAGGAQAALAKASQDELQKFQKELYDRTMEDRKRRGQVQAMAPGAVSAKPLAGGLVNSVG